MAMARPLSELILTDLVRPLQMPPASAIIPRVEPYYDRNVKIIVTLPGNVPWKVGDLAKALNTLYRYFEVRDSRSKLELTIVGPEGQRAVIRVIRVPVQSVQTKYAAHEGSTTSDSLNLFFYPGDPISEQDALSVLGQAREWSASEPPFAFLQRTDVKEFRSRRMLMRFTPLIPSPRSGVLSFEEVHGAFANIQLIGQRRAGIGTPWAVFRVGIINYRGEYVGNIQSLADWPASDAVSSEVVGSIATS